MTKSLFAILLTATALTGCAHIPGAAVPEQVVETKVYKAPKPKVLPTKLEAEKPSQDPNYVSHDGANWSFPAAPTPAPVAGAKAPAFLEVAEVPTRAFHAYPVFDAQTSTLVDARFSPAVGKATWQVIPHGAPIVSKVKLTLSDGTTTVSDELSPADLELPTDLAAVDTLSVPLANRVTMAFLAKAPDATHVLVVIELVDTKGEPVKDQDGRAFKLQLPVDVM